MSSPKRAWVSTGHRQHIETRSQVDRVPPFDRRSGNHLWIITTAYRVDPATWVDPAHTPILDAENLLILAGPGCYYCEQPYTPRLAQRRCTGEA